MFVLNCSIQIWIFWMIWIWIFISSLSSSTQCNNVKQSLEPCSRQRTCRDCGDMWYFNYLSRFKLSCLHSFNSVETVLQVVWRTLKCSHSMEWLTRPAPAISSVIRAENENGPAEKWRLYFDRLQESWMPRGDSAAKNCLPCRAALSALRLPIKCERANFDKHFGKNGYLIPSSQAQRNKVPPIKWKIMKIANGGP